MVNALPFASLKSNSAGESVRFCENLKKLSKNIEDYDVKTSGRACTGWP